MLIAEVGTDIVRVNVSRSRRNSSRVRDGANDEPVVSHA
jgi:hypothetical protein